MAARHSHFSNATNKRRARVTTYDDGAVVVALFHGGFFRSARRQPSTSIAREIALNWTRGVYNNISEIA